MCRIDAGDGGRLRAVTTKPTFIPPMLATLVGAPFDDPDWLFEVKWDGFRVEAVVDGGDVRLWTRGEQDASRYFGPFLDPPTWLDARRAIVDGEVIALDEHGEPDFALLQARIKGRGGPAVAPTPFVYEVFDLLHLDGRSLLDEPLEERRRLLAEVLRPDPRVRLSEHIEADGIAFFEAARSRGLEGIMAKDRRSPYVPGKRTDRWLKVKIRPEQELVVGGWVTGTGTAVELGALLVGVYEDGALRYAGKVGAGFTTDNRAELLARGGAARGRRVALRAAAAARGRPRRAVAASRARHPRRVRRLDRRRPRPPGGLQGHRAREGPAQGHPRAPGGSTAGRRLIVDRQDAESTSRSFAAKPSGSPVWPYSPPRKPPWSLGKVTGVGAEPLGDGLRAAVRQLAVRLGTGGHDDPGRSAPAARRSRARSACTMVMFWTEQRVGAGAVVLGRHPEHRRIGRRLGGELGRASGPCG